MVICCGSPLSINNLAIVKRALPVSFSVKEIALYKGRGGEGKASGGGRQVLGQVNQRLSLPFQPHVIIETLCIVLSVVIRSHLP